MYHMLPHPGATASGGYHYEDCLPYDTKPLWQVLRAAFEAQAAS